jgi:NADH:ubiquinone oxidoreductase subunit 5 (subunit L)/multisubunit Na+/H+ antiporter MnhA subunit
MSIEAYGWLVLGAPLLGSIVCALLYRTVPARVTGWIGTAAIGFAFLAGLGAFTMRTWQGFREEPARPSAATR